MRVRLILIAAISLSYYGSCAKVVLTVPEENSAWHLTDDKFFGIALDTSIVADNFQGFNMSDRRLLKLVSNLSPSYLRIGGTMADRLYFSETAHVNHPYTLSEAPLDGGVCAYEELDVCNTDLLNFTMTGRQWSLLNEFAVKVNTKILFDLNSLIRNTNGSWNTDNAQALIEFSNRKGYDIDWQLGNEPDAFKHVFNYPVNATQLAKDFAVLRDLLDKFPRYRNALLVGPDTTRPRPEHHASAKYLEQFLQTSNQHVLDAITFHQYYLNGRTAALPDFLDPATFALFEGQLTLATELVQNSPLQRTPLWLTETASAYGGGAPGLSDAFVASFLWLDKLGLAAQYGLATVIRQSIFRGHYALITEHYEPTPDWWLSVLFNELVGPEVLLCKATAPSTVRLYCHCSARAQSSASAARITVFGINISNCSTHIHINNTGTPENGSLQSDAYILTAAHSSLTSKKVLLNGELLKLSAAGDVPEFPKKTVDAAKPLRMPAYSLAFWLIPGINMAVCSPATVTQL